MSENRGTLSTPSQYFYPKVVLLSLILTGSIISGYSFFNRFLKQYAKVSEIPSNAFRKEWLYGKVTAVGDGDNFHFFHTPGGIRGGWGWLRFAPGLDKSDPPPRKQSSQFKNIMNWRENEQKRYSNLHSKYKNRRNLPTLPIRLCGVDAPERAHFGNPAQPYSEEALNWLRYTLLGRHLWVKPLSIDQYGRCVAKVEYWGWTGWRNVSVEMIRRGLGVVYESKNSAEFDGEEDIYRFHETVARTNRKGLWGLKHLETPGEYKKRVGNIS